MQRTLIHEAEQSSTRVRLAVRIVRHGLTVSNHCQDSVPAHSTLEHPLDGMAAEYHSFAFHWPPLSYQLPRRGISGEAVAIRGCDGPVTKWQGS